MPPNDVCIYNEHQPVQNTISYLRAANFVTTIAFRKLSCFLVAQLQLTRDYRENRKRRRKCKVVLFCVIVSDHDRSHLFQYNRLLAYLREGERRPENRPENIRDNRLPSYDSKT